jgi:hypothetical protein
MAFLHDVAVECEAEDCVVPPLKSMFRAYEKAWVQPEIQRGKFERVRTTGREYHRTRAGEGSLGDCVTNDVVLPG